MDEEEITRVRPSAEAHPDTVELCKLAGGPDLGMPRLGRAVHLYRGLCTLAHSIAKEIKDDGPRSGQ